MNLKSFGSLGFTPPSLCSLHESVTGSDFAYMSGMGEKSIRGEHCSLEFGEFSSFTAVFLII